MALATSKRKFYKLLDDLSGTTKRPPTDAPSSSADRPSKRSRTLATATFRAGSRDSSGAPGRANSGRTTVRLLSSTFESRAGPSGASTSPATATATTGTSAAAAAAAATPAQVRLGGLPATYAPWSHEQFLDRLRTFADVKRWRPKPPAVGEVAWARRGWEVVGDDEVACSFCGRHVVLRLDGGGGDGEPEDHDGGNASEHKWWTVEVEEQLVAKYEALVVNGHSEECLWRAAGCKGLFAVIGFARTNMLQTTFSESSLGT
jgi:C3HC zinc finger-like